ncbi:MAG: hypothetical protein ABSF95_20430 [Verrucomicrobiota bacterium]
MADPRRPENRGRLVRPKVRCEPGSGPKFPREPLRQHPALLQRPGRPDYLRRHGYKLVRRTGYNNWYVPRNTPVSVFSMCSFPELLRLDRKMWLNTPFNRLRHWLKHRKRARAGAPWPGKVTGTPQATRL